MSCHLRPSTIDQTVFQVWEELWPQNTHNLTILNTKTGIKLLKYFVHRHRGLNVIEIKLPK